MSTFVGVQLQGYFDLISLRTILRSVHVWCSSQCLELPAHSVAHPRRKAVGGVTMRVASTAQAPPCCADGITQKIWSPRRVNRRACDVHATRLDGKQDQIIDLYLTVDNPRRPKNSILYIV
jgi:hypothetical protein